MKITPRDVLQQNLQNILVPVFEWDIDGRENSKLMLRHVIEKLIRKLVYIRDPKLGLTMI